MLKRRHSEFRLEAGCDEAGRGCLAGPVFAAAVILPGDFDCPGLNDSKLLSPARRDNFRERIEAEALAWAIGIVDNQAIDEVNILNASIAAMHQAIAQLTMVPEFLLIDGNRFKRYKNIPYLCVVKGDSKYLHIAAASVLAKTHRDEFMQKIHGEYPQYGWDRNKGYPTLEHRQAIARHGVTAYHRKSFKINEQLKLFR
jgi:ribonuclease HII